MTREAVLQYVLQQYGVSPDYPWDDLEDAAVLRHRENRKWFALIMGVGRDKLSLPGF